MINEQAHVCLDGRKNPIPLTQELTKRINSIPPHTLWSGRCTQGLVSIKKTPHPIRVALTTAKAKLKLYPPQTHQLVPFFHIRKFMEK